MPKRDNPSRVPPYRRHKPSGQAVVTLNRRAIYLGKWATQPSKAEHDRRIGKWFANGRSLPDENGRLTVAEVALRFWEYAAAYYQKGGRPTSELDEYRLTIRPFRELYGSTPAREFGPLAFKCVREAMVRSGLSRGVVNHRMARLRRNFKWAASEELVPAAVYQGLTTVEGLKKGRTPARETGPVLPVAGFVVEAALPQLPEVVADMVRFQRHPGCRPSEACAIRPCDVDTSGDVWIYRPKSHKTEHHGMEPLISIGPKAQDVLRPYLLRPAETSLAGAHRPTASTYRSLPRSRGRVIRPQVLKQANIPWRICDLRLGLARAG